MKTSLRPWCRQRFSGQGTKNIKPYEEKSFDILDLKIFESLKSLLRK